MDGGAGTTGKRKPREVEQVDTQKEIEVEEYAIEVFNTPVEEI